MYCAHCGREVATLQAACPTCGNPASGAPRPKGGGSAVAIAIGAIFAGLVLIAVLGIVAAIAIPNFLNAVNRGRQKRTAADLRTIAVAIDTWAVEHGTYPPAGTASELPGFLAAPAAELPMTDGWGHALAYSCWQEDPASPGCDSYVMVSPGADGVLEHTRLEEYPRDLITTERFDADIVLRDGAFVQLPVYIDPRR